jgi:PTS system mannose-specific IID component
MLIQGSMNFERMHNLGIIYILLPALKVIYKDEEKLKEVVKGHLEFYNCHPYMSSFVLGTVIKLEEKRQRGELPNGNFISQVKTGMMGPLAAMGDLFFWRTLRPIAAVIAVTFALNGYLYAPLVFLVLYNIPHICIRVAGVFLGYKEDVKIIKKIQSFNVNNIVKVFGAIGIFFSAVLFANILHWDIVTIPNIYYFAILFFALFLLKRGIKVLNIFAIFMVITFIFQLIKG